MFTFVLLGASILISHMLTKGMEDVATRQWLILCKKIRQAKIISSKTNPKTLKHLILEKLTTHLINLEKLPEELLKSVENCREALSLLDADSPAKETLIDLLQSSGVLDVISNLRFEKLLGFLVNLSQETEASIPLPLYLSHLVTQARALGLSTLTEWQERLRSDDIYFIEGEESTTEYPAIVSLLLTNCGLSLSRIALFTIELVNLSAKRNHLQTLLFLQKIRAAELNVLGCCPLYWAVYQGHYELVEALLDDPLAQLELASSRNVLLNLAERNGHRTILELLYTTSDSTIRTTNANHSVLANANTLGEHNWQALFF